MSPGSDWFTAQRKASSNEPHSCIGSPSDSRTRFHEASQRVGGLSHQGRRLWPCVRRPLPAAPDRSACRTPPPTARSAPKTHRARRLPTPGSLPANRCKTSGRRPFPRTRADAAEVDTLPGRGERHRGRPLPRPRHTPPPWHFAGCGGREGEPTRGAETAQHAHRRAADGPVPPQRSLPAQDRATRTRASARTSARQRRRHRPG